MSSPIVCVRLRCELFYIDVRVREIGGRFLASADTPDRPSLGIGPGAFEAIMGALAPFEGLVDELLDSLPSSMGRR